MSASGRKQSFAKYCNQAPPQRTDLQTYVADLAKVIVDMKAVMSGRQPDQAVRAHSFAIEARGLPAFCSIP